MFLDLYSHEGYSWDIRFIFSNLVHVSNNIHVPSNHWHSPQREFYPTLSIAVGVGRGGGREHRVDGLIICMNVVCEPVSYVDEWQVSL